MRTRVESVEEAVAHAENLKRDNPSLLFRGQRKNWPVVPSFLRLDEKGRKECLDKLGRFEHWINITPGLEALRSETDAKIAIAQHYGIPTNFIDFSTEPRVAGFFATEGADADSDDEEACIVCLDPDDLFRLWKGIVRDQPPPELLRLEVGDLWRMQAQHGLFLFSPYKNLDTHFYDMDRIFFPPTHQIRDIHREEIYPSRKSHLEILIDQFFMTEKMLEFDENNIKNFQVVNLQIEWEDSDKDVYPNGISNHNSWQNADSAAWLRPDAEDFQDAVTTEFIRLKVDSDNPKVAASSVISQIDLNAVEFAEKRQKLVKWEVDVAHGLSFEAPFAENLASKLNRQWDGIRRLPYSSPDVIASLGTLVGYGVALRGDFANVSGHHWEKASEFLFGKSLYVEFGADDGSYSRSYVSVRGMQSAIRDDIKDFVSREYKTENIDHPINVLRMARVPQQLFSVDEFFSVFVREIVPTQVIMRSQAMYYSPVRLTKFGLA